MYVKDTKGKDDKQTLLNDSEYFALSATHLSRQNYALCFRREENKCGLCLAPALSGRDNNVDAQVSSYEKFFQNI
jgi:hypothetical protein